MIKKLEWDSSFFGFNIGEYKGLTMNKQKADRFFKIFKKSDFECVYLFLNSSDYQSIYEASSRKLLLADIRVYYELSSDYHSDGLQNQTVSTLDSKDQNNKNQVLLMSKKLSQSSRFYFDRRFRGKEEEMYTIWADKIMENDSGTIIVSLTEKKELAGFVACTINGGVSELALVYVAESFRGQGVGIEMVRSAIRWSLENNANKITVKTSLRNIASNRLYQKNNFFIVESKLIYHAWK